MEEPSRAAPITRNFALTTAVVVLVSIGIQALGWVSTKVLYLRVAPGACDNGVGASCAGLHFIGIVSFFLIITNSISALGDLRIQSAYVYYMARGGDEARLSGTYIAFRLASMLALGVGFVAFGLLTMPSWFTGNLMAVTLFAFLPALEAPGVLFSVFHRSRGRAAYGQLPLLVETALRTALLIVVALQFSIAGEPGGLPAAQGARLVTDMSFAYVTAAAASLLLAIPLLLRVRLDRIREALASMMRFAYPLMGAMFLTYLIAAVPPFFVEGLSGALGFQDLQIFNSAYAFLILLMFLPSAVTLPLFPDIASLHVRGLDREIRGRTRRALRLTTMLLAPAVLTVVVFRVDLLRIVYTAAVVNAGSDLALALLAATALPLALFRIMGTSLDAVGQQKRELYLSAVQLAVMVVVMALFIPSAGIGARLTGIRGVAGAALGVFLSAVAGFLVNGYYLHRYVRVRLPVRPYAAMLLAAAIAFSLFSTSFLGLFHISLPVSHVAVLLPVVVAGFLLYFGVLALLGELTREDVRYLLKSVMVPGPIIAAVERICWRDSWPDPEEPSPAPPP